MRTKSGLLVRLARLDDAAEIARIYNQGLEERIATFETEPRSVEAMRDQLVAKGERYPTVVVERDDRLAAWASMSAYSSRECYAGVGEHSVYADRDVRRSGAGSAALAGLIQAAEERGFWKLESRIFVENTASRALHLKLGFREVGIYRRHARLDDEWRDCVIVERLLGDALIDPE